MHHGISTVQRAFELARNGRCQSLADIRHILGSEGYESVAAHLSGPVIKRQLTNLLAAG